MGAVAIMAKAPSKEYVVSVVNYRLVGRELPTTYHFSHG
ncbi:hypothetical protein MRBBS_3643 [Marinobacter sp. BSs20148]|nr:hypothetical protein MRBBS_3643 [Marinobacter sp. BSs20148]